MKTLILIFIIILSFSVQAENVVQFTGGNYIFAENGKLIFNLEQSLFENRAWKYDPKTDTIYTSFRTNMPIKTLYTDRFTGYNVQLRSAFQYASFSNSNLNSRYSFGLVYNQKVFLPALGWAVRVGGFIFRSVAPPIVRKCLTNAKCALTVAGSGIPLGALCGMAYQIGGIDKFHAYLPKGVCAKVEADGFKKNKDNVYERDKSYSVKCLGGVCMSTSNGSSSNFGTYDAAVAHAKSKCTSSVQTPMGKATLTGSTLKNGILECFYKVDNKNDYYSSLWAIQEVLKKESITVVDIENFTVDDLKENPSQYMNANGELGDMLRKEIQANEAGITSDSKGTFSAIGYEPYRDPISGNTVQDFITVDSAKSSWNASPSGKAGNGAGGGAGTSNIVNNISVTHIDRSDVEDSANVGKPNNPNGTNGSTNTSGSSSTGGAKGDDSQTGGCEGKQNTVGCMPIGDLPTDTEMNVPEIGGGEMTIKPDMFLPSTGTCPAPIQISLGGKNINIEYEPLCDFALKVRLIVILMGALSAAYIVFRGFK